jgi:hypothetical protein
MGGIGWVHCDWFGLHFYGDMDFCMGVSSYCLGLFIYSYLLSCDVL